jgi:hypothetical protein
MCVNSQAFSVFAIVFSISEFAASERADWRYIRGIKWTSHISRIIHGKCSPDTMYVRYSSAKPRLNAHTSRRESDEDLAARSWHGPRRTSEDLRSMWRKSHYHYICLVLCTAARTCAVKPRVNVMVYRASHISHKKEQILTRFSVKIDIISRWTINLYFLLELRTIICV